MARDKGTLQNIDNSNPALYPNGRLVDNNGSGNGTPVSEFVYGDVHEFFAKLMRRYAYTYNGLPDNTDNNYQLVEAAAALPSKNDYIRQISEQDATTLTVNLKIGSLEENEACLCQTSVDFTGRTTIKGEDNTEKSISIIGTSLPNEYVLLVNTSSTVFLIRQVDISNIEAVVNGFGFLKKASQVEEDAGAIDTVATTPLVNKTTFIKRVIGADSVNYLATASQNGLLSAAGFVTLSQIAGTTARNIGFISPVDSRTSGGPVNGTPLTVGGDITVATYGNVVPGGRLIRCTMNTAMDNTDYYVRYSIEDDQLNSLNTGYTTPIFRAISDTQFDVLINQSGINVLNGRFHMEVIQR